MPRRIKQRPSVMSPAGDLIKRLAQSDSRVRRRLLKVAGWTLAALFVYSCMSGTYGIPRIVRLSMERSALEDTNRLLTAQVVENLRLRDRLRHDHRYIEYIARTRYHMATEGEYIYRYRGR